MHELSLAQNILQTSLDEAQRAGGKHIKAIHVKVTKPSYHSEDVSEMEFCLEVVAKDTPAEGAEMKVEFIPSMLNCQECGFSFPAEAITLVCPRCQGGKLKEVVTEENRLEITYTQ